MTRPTIQTLLRRLQKNHDADVRAVVDLIEGVVAERDAWQMKYYSLFQRFEELEHAINNQSGGSTSPDRGQKTKRDNASASTIRQTYDGDCGH